MSLDKRFRATLQKSPQQGGWTYLVWPDGTHKLPVKADLRRAIGKEAGDSVTVRLEERIEA